MKYLTVPEEANKFSGILTIRVDLRCTPIASAASDDAKSVQLVFRIDPAAKPNKADFLMHSRYQLESLECAANKRGEKEYGSDRYLFEKQLSF